MGVGKDIIMLYLDVCFCFVKMFYVSIMREKSKQISGLIISDDKVLCVVLEIHRII